jgi:hypothetical protein
MKGFSLSIAELARVLSVYNGVTTADGAVGKTTLIDSNLIGKNDFINGKGILILSGPAELEFQTATLFTAVSGTITFPAMSAQILAGVQYCILTQAALGVLINTISTNLNSLMADVGDASASTLGSLYGILGNPSTTIAANFEKLPDAVYIDTINGTAGTAYPIGTPSMPVSNLADAITIMTTRKLKVLVLSGTGAQAITLTNGLDISIVGNPEYAVTIDAGATVTIGSNLVCKSLANTTGTLNIFGNLIVVQGNMSTTTGNITIYGDLYDGGNLTLSTGGDITVYGDTFICNNITFSDIGSYGTFNKNLFCGGSMTVTQSGTIIVRGSLIVNSSLNTTSSNNIIVIGNVEIGNALSIGGSGSLYCQNCYIKTTLTLSNTGDIEVYGDLYVGSATTLSSSGSALTVKGSAEFHGTVDMTAAATITVEKDMHVYGDFTPKTGATTIGGNLTVTGVITNTSGSFICKGDVYCDDTFSTTSGNVIVYGNVTVRGGSNLSSSGTGDFVVRGNLYVGQHIITGGAGSTITVYGDIYAESSIAASAGIIEAKKDVFCGTNLSVSTGTITVRGKCHVVGQCNSTDTGDIIVYGELYVGSTTTLSNAGSALTVKGSFEAHGTVTNGPAGATITIEKDCDIYGTLANATGAMTVGGYLNVRGSITNTIGTGTITVKGGGVLRYSLAAANLTGTVTRWTLAGLIKVKNLGMKVTTVIPAGANTLLFSFTPTGGAATNLCGATDTAGAVAEQALFVDGVKATNLVLTTDPGIYAGGLSHMPIILSAGVIQTIFSAGPPATGASDLFIEWEPLTSDSSLKIQ